MMSSAICPQRSIRVFLNSEGSNFKPGNVQKIQRNSPFYKHMTPALSIRVSGETGIDWFSAKITSGFEPVNTYFSPAQSGSNFMMILSTTAMLV